MTRLKPDGHEATPSTAIHSAVVKQTSPKGSRLWPYALLALSPVTAAGVFMLTGWLIAAALSGLGVVVMAGMLFRDDGEHEVHLTLADGASAVVYRTRNRRKAERMMIRLGRSTALTDLTLDRARTGR